MNQYQEVIGRPAMPPYWALGYHQCRWGYKDLQEVKDVVNNFAKEEVGRLLIKCEVVSHFVRMCRYRVAYG